VKYTDPDGEILMRFTSYHKMNVGVWEGKPVGYSSNKEENYMMKIGCAVTGIANAINTIINTHYTPGEINDLKYFTNSGTDDDKSNIDFSKVASDNNLKHTRYLNDFKNTIQKIKENSENTVILAQVFYLTGNNTAKHYVGVNDLVTIDNNDYIEISPTSKWDSVSTSRRKTWLFQDGKVYVPLTEIQRIEVFTKKQEQ